MNITEFKDAWKRVEKVGKAVKGMSDSREDDTAFLEFYSDFRGNVDTDLNFLFPDYDPNSRYADNTKQTVLGHASGYQRGILDNAINNSTSGLEDILNGAQTELGKKLPGFVAMSMEPRVDAPEGFVSAVKNYRAIMQPLSKENADPEKIKNQMKKRIDDRIGPNPSSDMQTIAEAIKNLYDNEGFARAVYIEAEARPAEESLKAAIESGNEWKQYIEGNVQELKKPEKLEFFLGLYNSVRD